jgi:hypothetical protein
VRLHVETPFGGTEAVLVELIDSDLNTQRQRFPQARSANFTVAHGAYLLRVHWSDGQQTQQGVSIGVEDLELAITPPESDERPLLELGDPITGTSASRAGLFEVPPELFQLDASMQVDDDSGVGTWNRPWEAHQIWRDLAADDLDVADGSYEESTDRLVVSIWRKGESGWHRSEPALEDHPIDDGIAFEVDIPEGLHVIEVGGPGLSQFVSLPSEQSIVALRSYEHEGVLSVRADARSSDREVEGLRSHIIQGNLEVAHEIAARVTAQRYLREKVSAPRVAALGAYFLLRVGDLERLHDWPDNLSAWKPWLPDGPVIAAWQRLRSPNPDYEHVFELLLDAERRGLPVYTEGVRLLRDGLDLFAADHERTWDVEAAQARLREYARAMVWSKSESTYFGLAPDMPHVNTPHVQASQPSMEEAELAEPEEV